MAGAGTNKKRVDVELLIRWAYLDELPKKKISSAEGVWDAVREYGQRGGIDVGQSGAQRYPHFGLPHPDAELIEKAVDCLGQFSIEQDFAMIVGELGGLISVNDFRPRKAVRVPGKTTEAGYYDKDAMPPAFAPRDVILLNTINVAALVTTHAVMGTRPDWTSAQPRPFQTPALHGRGAKIVGECRGKNLYTAGSYCPLRWSPSPIEVVLGRADYHVWRQALIRLSQTLELKDHEALPPAASAMPWLKPDEKHRVFSYAIGKQRPLPLKPSRPHPFPPYKNPKASKARKPA
jgi:hypothetical protein